MLELKDANLGARTIFFGAGTLCYHWWMQTLEVKYFALEVVIFISRWDIIPQALEVEQYALEMGYIHFRRWTFCLGAGTFHASSGGCEC